MKNGIAKSTLREEGPDESYGLFAYSGSLFASSHTAGYRNYVSSMFISWFLYDRIVLLKTLTTHTPFIKGCTSTPLIKGVGPPNTVKQVVSDTPPPLLRGWASVENLDTTVSGASWPRGCWASMGTSSRLQEARFKALNGSRGKHQRPQEARAVLWHPFPFLSDSERSRKRERGRGVTSRTGNHENHEIEWWPIWVPSLQNTAKFQCFQDKPRENHENNETKILKTTLFSHPVWTTRKTRW